MGFKLTNEGKIIPSTKLILSERFILQEAVDWPALKTTCTELTKFVNDLQEILNNDHSGTETSTKNYQAFRNALKAIQDAQKNISKVNDPAVVIGELKKYLAELSNAFEAIDPTFKANNAEFNKAFENLINIIKDDPATTIERFKDKKGNETLINTIRSSINTVNKALQGFINDKTALRGDRKAQANAAKAAKKSNTVEWTTPLRSKMLTQLSSLLAVANKLFEKDTASASTAISEPMAGVFNSLLAVKKTISPDATKLADAVKTDISNADPFFEEIKITFENDKFKTDINDVLKYGKEKFGIAGEEEAGKAASEGTDWGALYAELGDIDVFWKKYFAGYWGDHARLVEALGEAFRQECKVMGFNDKVNPFINFLKIYLVKNNYKITANNYVPLHDAVAKGIGITRADLAKVTTSTESDVPTNMLVCFKDYFDKPEADAPKYFDYLLDFAYLRLESLKASTNPTIDLVLRCLKPELRSDEDAIRTIIFYELPGYSVKELFAGTTTELTSIPRLNGKTTKLRTIADVRQLMELFKNELGGGAGKKWDDEDSDTLFTKLALTDADKIKELLYTVVVSYGDVDILKKVTGAGNGWDTYTLAPAKMLILKDAIEKTGGKSRPDAGTVSALIKKIINYAETRTPPITDAAILALKPIFDK